MTTCVKIKTKYENRTIVPGCKQEEYWSIHSRLTSRSSLPCCPPDSNYLFACGGKITSLISTWANQSFWIKPSLRAFLSRFWIGWTVKEVLYNQQKFCLIYIEKMRHFNHPPGPTCWGTMRSGVWKKCESVTWNLYSLEPVLNEIVEFLKLQHLPRCCEAARMQAIMVFEWICSTSS